MHNAQSKAVSISDTCPQLQSINFLNKKLIMYHCPGNIFLFSIRHNRQSGMDQFGSTYNQSRPKFAAIRITHYFLSISVAFCLLLLQLIPILHDRFYRSINITAHVLKDSSGGVWKFWIADLFTNSPTFTDGIYEAHFSQFF